METKTVIVGVIGTIVIAAASSTAAVFYSNLQSPKRDNKTSEVVSQPVRAEDEQTEIQLKAENEAIKVPVVTDTPKPSSTNTPSPTQTIKPTNKPVVTPSPTVLQTTVKDQNTINRETMSQKICEIWGDDCQQGKNLVSASLNKNYNPNYTASGDFYGVFPLGCKYTKVQEEMGFTGNTIENLADCKAKALNPDYNIRIAYSLYKKHGYRIFYGLITGY